MARSDYFLSRKLDRQGNSPGCAARETFTPSPCAASTASMRSQWPGLCDSAALWSRLAQGTARKAERWAWLDSNRRTQNVSALPAAIRRRRTPLLPGDTD